MRDLIKDCFVTGKWKSSEDADELLRLDDMSDADDDDMFGDYEDLETGKKHTAKGKPNKNNVKSEKDDSESDGDEGEFSLLFHSDIIYLFCNNTEIFGQLLFVICSLKA